MNAPKEPVTIKKYANRRLYNTGASSYVTLEDLAEMVKKGEDFLVYDAKSGDDITRSVLAQIIFEQETKVGQNLLPIAFLRQLIRYYGDSMQALVPRYLEFSLERLTNEQQKIRDQMTSAFGAAPFAGPQAFASLEEMTRANMAMFEQAFALFNPFAALAQRDKAQAQQNTTQDASPKKPSPQELDALKKELAAMRERLDKIG
jgi:polyhydroxyalkanoate synthesis repressor PhaR